MHNMMVQVIKCQSEDAKKYGEWRIEVNHGEWGQFCKTKLSAIEEAHAICDRYKDNNPFLSIDARG